MNPKVSVILPTWNRSGSAKHMQFVRECVASLQNQVCDFEFEILIGTEFPQKGQSAVYLQELVTRDKRVKVLYQQADPRTGHGPTDNDLVRLARGQYMTRPLGDDEVFEPNMLQELVDAIEVNHNHVLAFGDFCNIDEVGKITHKLKRGPHDWKRLMQECYIGIAVLIDRAFWLDQMMQYGEMKAAEDWDAWKNLAAACLNVKSSTNHNPTFVHVPKYLARWRDWEGNLTAGVRDGSIEPGKVYES